MDLDRDNTNSLARKLGGTPSQPQIHKFLKGTAREPRRATLQPLADHFGLPLDAFYDGELVERIAFERGLRIAGTSPEPAADSPPPPPAPDLMLTPRIQQLLRDLDDLAPSKASKLIDQIHQEAEEAREAARHQEAKRGKVAALRTTITKASATVSWGDGNERQTSLPLTTVKDPFTAAPGERESALYSRIERVPKDPKK